MLSIAKLRVGQEAYQLSGVAQSLDDYYTGRGEADGTWLGGGAERLGLDGPVAADDLRAVLAGMAPGSGGLTPDGSTVRAHVRRVPGFDLTFKTPKSVSVLYAVSDDPRVQGAIIEAGETAVRAAVAWLEREAIWVRRGSGDTAYVNDLAARDPDAAEAARQRPVRGNGLVAAAFRHRTSRAGDPLLHWHTLVANLVEGPDERWGAFVHPELYRHARAAGEVFQTVLRGELTARLGLQWRAGTHVSEVAGVPHRLCTLFSKRAAEIDAWLRATGTPNDAVGRQAAVLATRRNKPELEGERFDAAWKVEAAAAGWGPDHADALVAATAAGRIPDADEVWRIPTVDESTGAVVDRPVDVEAWIAVVGRALTDSDSTFTRPDLVRAVATRIGEGATPTTIERAVARVLASPQVVPIADSAHPRWTTTELLGVEQGFLASVRTSSGTRRPLRGQDVERILADAGLGADQAAAVRMLARSGDAVSVMVGPAGTGKTFTLDVVRRVFAAAGYTVIGAAPSARAAHELQEDAHITASTIHRLVGSWDRGFDVPNAATVLVVDEAGMAGIRDLHRVVSPVVAAGGRVLLVGDHHQLPEVVAGGGFAALATDPTVTVAALSVNRRQQHGWEIAALAELRDGHVAKAVDAYRANGRVVAVADRAELVTAGVARWVDAHRAGRVPVLLGGTNEIVDDLNTAARRLLLDGGILRPAGTVPGRAAIAVGERLMIRANNYRATSLDGQTTAVLNGQTGTLTAVTAGGLVVRMDHDDSDVMLPHRCLDDGDVGYAYAMTAHKAQGGTWDLAITVGLDGLYREAGYVVMSRGRDANWLVVTQPELDQIDVDLARHDSALPLPGEAPATLDAQLLARLGTSRRKQLAHTRDPHAPAIQHAATTIDYPTLEHWADYAHVVEHHAGRIVGDSPARLRQRLARIDHTARHARIGVRVKAWDRRNIGTITGVDDNAGTIEVTFVAVDGREATRNLGWADVTVLNPDQMTPRALTAVAAATLDAVTRVDRARVDAWQAVLAAHGVQPDDRDIYRHAVDLAIDRAAALLTAEQPSWLTQLIGERPLDHPAATQVWDDAIRDLATHRLRHDITDPSEPVGPDILHTHGPALWTAASPRLAAARLWITTHHQQPRLAVTRTRSRNELYRRSAELDRIFDQAPADQRPIIRALHTDLPLPADQLHQALTDAANGQDERRRWILEHWPHIVEAEQLNRTIRDDGAGADIDRLVDQLNTSQHSLLAAAAGGRDRWLVTAVGQLAADATTVPADLERLLGDIADYRDRWHITAADPLGEAATTTDQADRRFLLIAAVDAHHTTTIHADQPPIDRPDPNPHVTTLT